MNVNQYYKTLITYRDGLDTKVNKGKVDINKAMKLIDKLNEWYDQAKRVERMEKIKGEK